jgi:hypothetical protein
VRGHVDAWAGDLKGSRVKGTVRKIQPRLRADEVDDRLTVRRDEGIEIHQLGEPLGHAVGSHVMTIPP